MKQFLVIIVTIVFIVTLCGCSVFEANENNYQSTTHEYKTDVEINIKENADQNMSNTLEDVKDLNLSSIDTSSNIQESVVEEMFIQIDNVKTDSRELVSFGEIDSDLSKIESILDGYGQKISIMAYSVDGKKAIAYNTDQKYFSACTIKAAYVLSCCKQIDKGLCSPEEMMAYESHHYHKGSGKIKNQAYGTKYSIKTLLHEALFISDNVAYEMLVDRFGHEYYNQMVTDLGCTGLKLRGLWSHDVTVKDMVLLWQEIASYIESNKPMSEVMRKACTNSPFNYGCQFMNNIDYSHKSGDNFGDAPAYNDAGIIWAKNPYIYVVLTNSEGGSETKNVINETMSKIFDIMQSSDEEIENQR